MAKQLFKENNKWTFGLHNKYYYEQALKFQADLRGQECVSRYWSSESTMFHINPHVCCFFYCYINSLVWQIKHVQ